MPCKTTPVLVDSHVHLDDQRLKTDLGEVLAAARRQNIRAQVVPATSQKHWLRLKQLCDSYDDLHPCYGLHPYFCDEHSDEHLLELSHWLKQEPVVAVGECGLDYAILDTAATHSSATDEQAHKARQKHLFEAQLNLAKQFDLPIVIHAVRAVDDVIQMIRASGHHRGVVHSFNGSAQQAHRLIDLGYLLSFGGAMTYPRAKRLRTLVSELPLDTMMLETDAPDQPAAGHKGQRNEPAYLIDIWRAFSELRKEGPELVAKITTQNAQTLFALGDLSAQTGNK